MLKKLLTIAAAISALAFTACNSYEVVLIGDVHYTEEALHLDLKNRHNEVQYAVKTNVEAWQGDIPVILKTAADYANEKSAVAFTVQLGDFVEGLHGNYDLHKKAVTRSLAKVSAGHEKPVYFVKGNHDSWGNGGTDGCYDVLLPYMAKYQELKHSPIPKRRAANYTMKLNGDLYIFYDWDISFILKALKENPDVRYTFLISHIPLLPCDNGNFANWVISGDPALRKELLKLMAERNAIVLAAHTHKTSLFRYTRTDGTITQFTSYSRVKKLTDRFKENTEKDGNIYFTEKYSRFNQNIQPLIADLFHNHYEPFTYFDMVGGFNVLKVNDRGVYMDIYGGNLKKPVKTVTLIEK